MIAMPSWLYHDMIGDHLVLRAHFSRTRFVPKGAKKPKQLPRIDESVILGRYIGRHEYAYAWDASVVRAFLIAK